MDEDRKPLQSMESPIDSQMKVHHGFFPTTYPSVRSGNKITFAGCESVGVFELPHRISFFLMGEG